LGAGQFESSTQPTQVWFGSSHTRPVGQSVSSTQATQVFEAASQT
jgi:hypothetical protein